MTNPKDCPDEQELYDLARGTIPGARAPLVREHIGDCQACRLAVAEFASMTAESEARVRASRMGDAPPTRYELDRLLATGGMGEVFVAKDTLLGREVAIKFLHEDTDSPEALAASRRRVLREAQALASFTHPNVVAVYDQGVLDGRAFLAMEYVRGRTLRQWIEDEKPDDARITDALLQAGKGLLAAHEAGLVHRDFKPDNVLIGDDGRVRVTDFGLARLDPDDVAAKPWKEAISSSSIEGTIAGTPAYMAPELFEGTPADARSDQYAFAVSLHEAIHGARPAAGETGARNTPPRPTPAKSARLAALIARGLSANPADRFPSMREVVAELEAPGSRTARRARRRALVFAGAAAFGLILGSGIYLRRGAARTSSLLATAPAGLHAPCTSGSGGCPMPLVCRYPTGNYCGVADKAGTCGWPDDGCTAKSPEVCGCDGVTYKNNCEAHAHGVGSATRGACVTCTPGSACPDVNGAGVLTPAFCRTPEPGGPAQEKGVCLARPSACAPGGPAVCGRDGLSYENVCEARRAGTDADHPGPCASDARGASPSPAHTGPSRSGGLTVGAPDEAGMDARPLISLAKWVEADKPSIFSILISRNGVLVFELYTSGFGREDAAYLWGVTGAVTSALVGAAIDRHLVPGPETSIADALPAELFASEADRERFRAVTISDVLAMSALDAPVSPTDPSEATKERLRQFLASKNRAKFALTQPLLPSPGTSYQYSDVTADLATAVVEYGAKKTALDLAEEVLFQPMGFQNYEWRHQDDAGIDSGSYGLCLRPFDLQKLGVLFLHEGVWEDRQLLSSEWAKKTFSPWLKTTAAAKKPDYGWFWSAQELTREAGTGTAAKPWPLHIVRGWKGQRLAVFPDQGVVVTMTSLLEPPEEESTLFNRILLDYVVPSVDGTGAAPPRPDPALRGPLASVLEEVRGEPMPARLKENLTHHPDAMPAAQPRGRPHHGLR